MAEEAVDKYDIVNRDPLTLNPHLRVLWQDTIAEPDGTHSIDFCWNCSFKCYTIARSCCYKVLTTLFGWCYALGWGCAFAQLSFCHVWYCTPCLKYYMINLGACKMLCGSVVRTCCDPCCEAFGRCFSDIRVTNMNG